MNRNTKGNRDRNCKNDSRNYKGKKRPDKRNRSKEDRYNETEAKLNAEGRPNDPNYYFLDKEVAGQVSQLSFQTLGGVPFNFEGSVINYPNIKVHYWNPSPGVTTPKTTPALNQTGINMAGLRIFTKLSAFTGRTAVYGPQDISTMILGLGEIISVMEWIRRVFGVAFLGSETNRTYPRALLQAMRVNDVDFYPRYAEYRNRFNKLVTLINQIPIPQNIAYFDKCAHMYEKIYLDAQSPLATSIVDNIATTWLLDETSYQGGTILKTCTFTVDKDTGVPVSEQRLSYYLDWAETLINNMLNSSTLQVVYTDILNLASKVETKFWKFDYLIDGYMVIPEYNPGYLLQMHNATIAGIPTKPSADNTNFYTPLNDVYPDANNNWLQYNPGFKCLNTQGGAVFGSHMRSTILDMLTPNPSIEDRIEVIRWVALGSGSNVKDAADNTWYEVDLVLADHYIAEVSYFVNGVERSRITRSLAFGTDSKPVGDYYHLVSVSTKVDWDSLYYAAGDPGVEGVLKPNSNIVGDLNYFTKVDDSWLRPIFDFTALALYELRA